MDKKLNLYEVMKHSKLSKKVRIYDAFDLVVRPWTVLQMQRIMPFITKLTKEYKSLNLDYEKIKGRPVYALIMDVLPILEKSKEMMDEILEFVYMSLELTNETVTVDLDGKVEVMPFFTREEMIKYLLLPDLGAILAAMIEVNFTKNPSLAELKP